MTKYTYQNSPPMKRAETEFKDHDATLRKRFQETHYDGLGRVVKTTAGIAGGNPLSVVETEYVSCACSANGKVGRVSQPYAPGGTVYWTEYDYDELGRLVKEQSVPGSSWSGTRTWGYDGFGNRTAVNGWGPGVDPATNRLIAAEGYQYDANGSVTLMPGVSVDKQLEWSALNRLEKVTQGAESEEYEYSPAGQRVFWKRVGGMARTRGIRLGLRRMTGASGRGWITRSSGGTGVMRGGF